MIVDDLNFSRDGLLPVVVQDHRSGKILMVGFANRDAVEKTLETGHAWFFSRSRERLWEKGETSGNFLDLKGVRVDCDGDALIYLCEPHGPTCHTGQRSCFFNTLDPAPVGETSGEAAAVLFDTIKQRQARADPEHRPPAGEPRAEFGVFAQAGQQPVQSLRDRLTPGPRERLGASIDPDPGRHAQVS